MKFPQTLRSTHQQLLEKIITAFSQDPRILGIGASGSFASDSMDKYSDLDLVIAVEPSAFDTIMTERFEIIDRVEGKLAAFTGEHVGEPRQLSLFRAKYDTRRLQVRCPARCRYPC